MSDDAFPFGITIGTRKKGRTMCGLFRDSGCWLSSPDDALSNHRSRITRPTVAHRQIDTWSSALRTIASAALQANVSL